MDLHTYITQSGGVGTLACPVVARIAKKAGCSPGTLYQVSRKLRKPSWRLAEKISAATKGDVSKADLRADIFGTPNRKRA
jgi:DNA-binding transcriptional regulator YdaS (Cro superfamily)